MVITDEESLNPKGFRRKHDEHRAGRNLIPSSLASAIGSGHPANQSLQYRLNIEAKS